MLSHLNRYSVSFEEFKKLSSGGNLFPLYYEILADCETAVSSFLKVRGEKDAFLFESVQGGENWSRYSFIGLEPELIVSSCGNQLRVEERGEVSVTECENPFKEIQKLLSRYRYIRYSDELPRFSGGAVGYLGFDMVRHVEVLPEHAVKDIDIPDSYLGVSRKLIVFDNLKKTIKIIYNIDTSSEEGLEFAFHQAKREIQKLLASLRSSLPEEGSHVPELHKTPLPLKPSSSFAQEEFMAVVERAKEYIRAGDLFQVVLAQRLSFSLEVDSFEVYRALRLINPSPYMYYLRSGDVDIIGSSPEILVRLEQGEVTVRPIAGTRPRGKTEEEDYALEKELLHDKKELAEHVMLVDLGRNDIGRVCKPGTIHVTEREVIERYSHVMHIVSHVKGELQEGKDAFDVLAACFPAGTVSGAPKVRAMEVIDELEPVRRAVYAGCVGYFDFSGNMDMAIAIRTLYVHKGTGYLGAGAGIVYDSDPESEYQETMNKAKALLNAVELAKRLHD